MKLPPFKVVDSLERSVTLQAASLVGADEVFIHRLLGANYGTARAEFSQDDVGALRWTSEVLWGSRVSRQVFGDRNGVQLISNQKDFDQLFDKTPHFPQLPRTLSRSLLYGFRHSDTTVLRNTDPRGYGAIVVNARHFNTSGKPLGRLPGDPVPLECHRLAVVYINRRQSNRGQLSNPIIPGWHCTGHKEQSGASTSSNNCQCMQRDYLVSFVNEKELLSNYHFVGVIPAP